MPDGGDVEELEGTLEGEVDDEHDDGPDAAGYLRTGEQYLAALEEQAKQAGHQSGLAGLRKAIKRTASLVEQAEQRGFRRGRAEQLTPEVREQITAEIRAELEGETARTRNLARLGVPPELEPLFPPDLPADFAAYQRVADGLHSRGVSWGSDTDPLVRAVAQQRTAAWQEQATQAAHAATNGVPTAIGPAPGVPDSVREQVIAEASGVRRGAGGWHAARRRWRPPGPDHESRAAARAGQPRPGPRPRGGVQSALGCTVQAGEGVAVSEQAFDLQEAIYGIGDVASDPGQAAQQLRALADRLSTGQQYSGVGGQGGPTTALVGEATPRPTPEAVSFTELAQQVPDVQRAVAAGDEEAAREAAWQLAEGFNAAADRNLRAERPDLFPAAPAESDQQLQELLGRARAAQADPGSVGEDGILALAESTNQTVDRLRDQHEQAFDAMEQQRAAAERARAAQRRKEQPTIEQLKRVVAQYEAGQQPAGGR